jgi:anti-sigma factor RsiW
MQVHLAASPADAARAEAWRRQNDALRAAFADTLTEPASQYLLPCSMSAYAETAPATSGKGSPEASRDGFWRGGMTLVGLCLAFLAGAATVLATGLLAERFETRKPLRQGSEPRGTEAPFVDRTLRAVVPYEARLADSSSDVGRSADLLIVPDLSGTGLRLTGIHTIPNVPSVTLCLRYSTAADVEVTLCIDTSRGEMEPTFHKPSDVSGPTISWRQKGARYSLAGALSDTELGGLADRARMEIDRFVAR